MEHYHIDVHGRIVGFSAHMGNLGLLASTEPAERKAAGSSR